MANENDGSFLSSVLTAASSTATSLATNLSDRFQESPQDNSGENLEENPQSKNSVDAKGLLAANPTMNLNKQRHGRTHSHTISGDRPPIIITSHRPTPSFQRRNSDGGSPGLGGPMVADNLLPAAPSTTTATSETAIFSSTSPSLSLEHLALRPNHQVSEAGSVHSGFSDATATNKDQGTPVADPEQPVTKEMLTVLRRSSRPRGSSVSTTNSLDAKGSSLSRSNSTASRTTALRRKDSDDTDVDNASEGGQSIAVGSIASACGMEIANAKRNSDYHALFRSVPEEDVLVEGLWDDDK
jgi:hypothetical protein